MGWSNGRGPHLEGRQEPQASSPFRTPTSDHRDPAELGQENQASTCLRKGSPLASRVAQGVSGPSSSCVLNSRLFPDDTRGCHCTFVLCLHPQVCHRSVVWASCSSQERIVKSWSLGSGTTNVAGLEFPREAGLIRRCARKAGNPFPTTQGNRLSCPDQEGRRCSNEVVPGHSVFPSREPGESGNFWGSQEGCQVPFRTSGQNMGLLLRRRSGQGPHLSKTWEPRGFSRVAAGFSTYDGDFRLPLVSAWEAQTSFRVAKESWGLRSAY